MSATGHTLEHRTVLVTGGAGFIGSHLVDRLCREGCAVRILDDLSTGHASNVAHCDVQLVEASILNADALAATIEDCDVVFHLAAMVSVPASFEQPRACLEINLRGTQAVLEAAVTAGCRRLVFAASSSAYGMDANLPSLETDPVAPASPYAVSKAAAEALVSAWGTCWDLDTVALRFFNIFGPRQDPNSPYAAAIAAFADALRNGRSPVFYGDGSQTRDFTYVDNAVEACLLAATCSTPLDGRVLNVGTGRGVSLLEVLEQMNVVLGTSIEATCQPPRTGDVPHSFADIAAISDVLGYVPVASLEEGLSRLLIDTAGLPT